MWFCDHLREIGSWIKVKRDELVRRFLSTPKGGWFQSNPAWRPILSCVETQGGILISVQADNQRKLFLQSAGRVRCIFWKDVALASFLKLKDVPCLLLSAKLPSEQITGLQSSPSTLHLRETSSRELKISNGIIDPQGCAMGAWPSLEVDSHLFGWWPSQAQDFPDLSLSPLKCQGISSEKYFYYVTFNIYKAKFMTSRGNDIVVLLALKTCSNAKLTCRRQAAGHKKYHLPNTFQVVPEVYFHLFCSHCCHSRTRFNSCLISRRAVLLISFVRSLFPSSQQASQFQFHHLSTEAQSCDYFVEEPCLLPLICSIGFRDLP